jgi:hypothetical protein
MSRRENPQAALELLILTTLDAGPNHGFGIALPKAMFRSSPTVLARLRPDVTPEQAKLTLETTWPEMMKLPPGFREEWRVRPLRDRRVGDAARVAWLFLGAVAVFLLIACVNVTNLMLARVGERRREFGIRAAIGAGRMRLARLALAESVLLALVAGAGGSIGVWPAASALRLDELQGLRSTATSSPGARPRLRFALVTARGGGARRAPTRPWRSARGRTSARCRPGRAAGRRRAGAARPGRAREARSRAASAGSAQVERALQQPDADA